MIKVLEISLFIQDMVDQETRSLCFKYGKICLRPCKHTSGTPEFFQRIQPQSKVQSTLTTGTRSAPTTISNKTKRNQSQATKKSPPKHSRWGYVQSLIGMKLRVDSRQIRNICATTGIAYGWAVIGRETGELMTKEVPHRGLIPAGVQGRNGRNGFFTPAFWKLPRLQEVRTEAIPENKLPSIWSSNNL